MQSSTDILSQIKLLWGNTRAKYRDGMIELGRLIVQYIRSRFRDAVTMNESERVKAGITRYAILKRVMSELGLSNTKVNEIIRTGAAADLLTDGNYGTLSYSSFRTMRVLIYRSNKGKQLRRVKIRHNEGYTERGPTIEPDQVEIWEIKTAVKDVAKPFVLRAISEGWTDKQLRENIKRLCSRQKFIHNLNKHYHSSELQLVKSNHDADTLNEQIGDLTDDELIDRLYSLVLIADDPDRILEALKRRLEGNVVINVPKLEDEKQKRLRAYEESVKNKIPINYAK